MDRYVHDMDIYVYMGYTCVYGIYTCIWDIYVYTKAYHDHAPFFHWVATVSRID